MKYTKQLLNMVEALRSEGFEVKLSNNTAYLIGKGISFESSSITKIYKGNEIIKEYKTPKSAIKYLVSNY